MEDFSDFQMAVGPSTQQKGGGPGTGTGASGFWGGPRFPPPSNGHFGGGLGPPPRTPVTRHQFPSRSPGPVNFLSSPRQETQARYDNNGALEGGVGSRLASYDCNNGKPVFQTGGRSASSNTGSNLLMGEEDKYAALRSLGSLDSSLLSSPEVSKKDIKSEDVFANNGPTPREPIVAFNTNCIPSGEEDDFGEFGDFQSFSTPSSNATPSERFTPSISDNKNVGTSNGLGNFGNRNLLDSELSCVPQSEFGDFVSVLPSNVEVQPSFIKLTHAKTNDRSNKRIGVLSSGRGETNFDLLGSTTATPSSSSKMTSALDEILDLSFSVEHTLQSNNDNDLTMPVSNMATFNDVMASFPLCEPTCIISNNSDRTESGNGNGTYEFDIPTSSILSNDDASTLRPAFMKTSLIGYGGFSDLESSDSFKSASILESGNEGMEFVLPIEKNKFDISPETRSIASLDLGNYCPPPDLPQDNKLTCEDEVRTLDLDEDDSEQNADEDDIHCRTTEEESPTDKYLCLKESALEDVGNWSKCLNSVKNIFSTAVALFSGASSSGVVREVVLTNDGENYITCLSEIYEVFSRISFSIQRARREGKMKGLCDEIRRLWEALIPYFIGTQIMESVSSAVTKEFTVGGKSCGICMTEVTSAQQSCIENAGEQYHAGCANFWINTVGMKLPSDASPVYGETARDISLSLL